MFEGSEKSDFNDSVVLKKFSKNQIDSIQIANIKDNSNNLKDKRLKIPDDIKQKDTEKDTPKDTPMMKQYHSIKKNYRDTILLFRLGDFYEMFEEDAVEATSILNITLTRRNAVKMCGFPYHAADSYISKLLKSGKRVAICEQVEDPKLAKGIVKRRVVEILSPGIITKPELLNLTDKNSVMLLYPENENGMIGVGCSICDVSTGYFFSRYISSSEDVLDELLNEIESNQVREVVIPEIDINIMSNITHIIDRIRQIKGDILIRKYPDYLVSIEKGEDVLKDHFSVSSIDVFEFENRIEVISAAMLLNYVKENTGQSLYHIRWIEKRENRNYLILDNSTRKHLELVENQSDGGKSATLFGVLDYTKTAMGSRLLKWVIQNPIRSLEEIKKRQDRVEWFYNNRQSIDKIRSALGNVLDIERIVSKISVGKANARDLVGLKNTLINAEQIFGYLNDIESFNEFVNQDYEQNDVISLINRAIVEDPPLSIKEGGIIKYGYNQKLDEYRRIRDENREWINKYQVDQRNKIGINNLRIGYNKVIGYYIEITKANLPKVPSTYIRKQTLVNTERFTTEELELHQAKLREAREMSDNLEYEIFMEICQIILKKMDKLYSIANSIASIDLFQSFAMAAMVNGYVRPEIVEENVLEITGGRHPVIERFVDVDFIENDLYLNDSDRRIMILTGPNMSGKSTYLRQNALIIIMAHMGSFVPASSAKIGVVDRIFSRIGMSDRLIKGESTFLVEMIETSRILHYSTPRSFVIMDEIGRGTSTFDGLSIAWSVLEYLLDPEFSGCKVLFATHYHEITSLGDSYGVVNYNATVKDWDNRVIFLRKIVPGCASKSYGVEVARMAGLPNSVIERAKEILSDLESNYGSYISMLAEQEVKKLNKKIGGKINSESNKTILNKKVKEDDLQLGLFPSPYEIIANELENLDINNITPIEALNILDRLKKSISNFKQ